MLRFGAKSEVEKPSESFTHFSPFDAKKVQGSHVSANA